MYNFKLETAELAVGTRTNADEIIIQALQLSGYPRLAAYVQALQQAKELLEDQLDQSEVYLEDSQNEVENLTEQAKNADEHANKLETALEDIKIILEKL